MKMETILVPTDFSDDAQSALEAAVDLAKKFGSRIVLMHAYHIDLPWVSPAFGGDVVLPQRFFLDLREQVTGQVERLAAELAEKEGIEVAGIAVDLPPGMGIVEEAERLSVDLIVMGTRGLTGIKHVALGSTAERVVRKAGCPVLTVKAKPSGD